MIAFLAQLLVTSPAVAISVTGSVEVETAAGRKPLARFAQVEEGATVITHDGTAQLRFASGSIVRLGPDTTVALKTLEHNRPAGTRRESVRLKVGRLWARVTSLFGDDAAFELETPNAVAGVRGTSFLAETSADNDRFVVVDGAVALLQQGNANALELNGAGASAMAQGSGLTSSSRLGAADVRALRRQFGGGGSLAGMFEETERGSGARSRQQRRNETRQDMTDPERPADTANRRDDRYDPRSGTVPVTVEIIEATR